MCPLFVVATTRCAVVRVWVTGFRPRGLRSFDTLASRAHLPMSSACHPHATCTFWPSRQCPTALSENRIVRAIHVPICVKCSVGMEAAACRKASSSCTFHAARRSLFSWQCPEDVSVESSVRAIVLLLGSIFSQHCDSKHARSSHRPSIVATTAFAVLLRSAAQFRCVGEPLDAISRCFFPSVNKRRSVRLHRVDAAASVACIV